MILARNPHSIEADQPSPLDEELTPLLDHIASELAREYVRLMEDAAAAESADNHVTRAEHRHA